MWEATPEVYDVARELVAEYHPDLALVVDEIAIVFKEKASSAGGNAVLGKAKKASPLFGVLGSTDYKFILELAADTWQTLTGKQQRALLDHLLCGCRVDEEDSGIKCSLAPPDIAFYFDEIDRWGDWRPRPEGEDGPSLVEKVFVKKGVNEDEDDATDAAIDDSDVLSDALSGLLS